MEISYIKEFVILAETQNYLEASDALFISQSSLSKHIKALEKDLGVSLFDRTTRKVSLSEFGELFLPYAKEIADLQYQYTTAILNRTQNQHQSIVIGSVPMIAPYQITDCIMKFQEENNKFSVRLVEGESAALKDLLRQNKCDLAFIRDMKEEDDEFSKLPFTTDRLAAVFPAGHPLAQETSVDIARLKNERFLFLQPDTMLFNICTRACEAAGFSPDIIFTGKRAENIVDLVEKGMGVALLMRKPVESFANRSISIVDVAPVITTKINLYYKKDTQLSLVARHFIDCVKLKKAGK
ncbi:MAG: LysR family transcriptional regulator [Lachnospiraceae bacterium]|nr:LysR family transcriptional regulator [Lachnospiraceae bacterium]